MYIDVFESQEDVEANFGVKLDPYVQILLAAYFDPYGYSGEAFVLYRKGGKLFEVNGSHCSCFGLEDQWGPEETSVEALRYRLAEGDMAKKPYGNALIEILDNGI